MDQTKLDYKQRVNVVVDKQLQDSHFLIRYLSYSKFIELIKRKSLFLSLASNFYDKFEGIPYDKRAMSLSFIQSDCTDVQWHEKFQEMTQKNYEASLLGSTVAVCCWTKSYAESYLMWQSYSNPSDGVAIVVPVKNLISSLLFDSEIPSYLYSVTYRGENIKNGIPDYLQSFFVKKPIFEDEKEVRLLVDLSGKDSLGQKIFKNKLDIAQRYGGIELGVELDMIDKIILAPMMPLAIEETIKKLCVENGINCDFIHSELKEKPEFPVSPWSLLEQEKNKK